MCSGAHTLVTTPAAAKLYKADRNGVAWAQHTHLNVASRRYRTRGRGAGDPAEGRVGGLEHALMRRWHFLVILPVKVCVC